MSKHTPGPWKAHNTVGAGCSVKTAKPRDGAKGTDPICSLAWWQFDIPGVIDNEISEANANLIAAAPEMLEALRDAVRLLKHSGVNSNFQKFAIAKATGETTDGMLVEIDASNVFQGVPAVKCERCDGDGKAHGSDRPFEYSGPDSYPGKCPVCKGSGTV